MQLEKENLKIMIVDDDEINLYLTSALLNQIISGAKIIQCKNGMEAIEKVEIEKPNIIFLDIQMPELDGKDTTIEIRKKESGKQIPIIALTAEINNDAVSSYKDAGMNDILLKPAKKELFEEILKKYFFKS